MSATKSKIEWTDTTWNPTTGCTKVSPGCANCYAETLTKRYAGSKGWPAEFKPWTPANAAKNVVLHPDRLEAPFSWRTPRRVFVNSMSDLFHEKVPFEYVDRVFAVMALTPQHTYQVLTKRPERMREYIGDGEERAVAIMDSAYSTYSGEFMDDWCAAHEEDNFCPDWPLPNIWLGVTVENQRFADERIPILLETPAAVRFVSCEPLLGPVDLGHRHWIRTHKRLRSDFPLDPLTVEVGLHRATSNRYGALAVAGLGIKPDEYDFLPMLDWVIVGGESGPKHRPFDPAWARSIVAQCRDAGVACFVKQLGGARPGNKLEDLPEDLRVREYPL